MIYFLIHFPFSLYISKMMAQDLMKAASLDLKDYLMNQKIGTI